MCITFSGSDFLGIFVNLFHLCITFSGSDFLGIFVNLPCINKTHLYSALLFLLFHIFIDTFLRFVLFLSVSCRPFYVSLFTLLLHLFIILLFCEFISRFLSLCVVEQTKPPETGLLLFIRSPEFSAIFAHFA